MSTRTSDLAGIGAALLLLAACQQVSPEGEPAGQTSPIEAVKGWVAGIGDERPKIFCAMDGKTALAQDCRIEIVEDATSRIYVLHRPDGGFRRVRQMADGSIVAADGAIEARVALTGEAAGILFGDERYAVPVAMLAPGGGQ